MAGVDEHVGLLARLLQQLPLGGDAVGEPAVALQRMWPADAFEPPDQHLVVGVDEDDPRVETALPQRLDRAGEVGGERPAAHVEHHRGAPRRAAGRVRQLGHVEHQRLRQVVDDVVADVFQGPGHRAAAATGDPGHDHKVGLRPLRIGHLGGGRRFCVTFPLARRATLARTAHPDRSRSPTAAWSASPRLARTFDRCRRRPPDRRARRDRSTRSRRERRNRPGRPREGRSPPGTASAGTRCQCQPGQRCQSRPGRRPAGTGHRTEPVSAARIASAVRRPMPGTSAISSTLAVLEPLDRTELPQQRLAPDLAEARARCPGGRGHPLGPLLPVVGDREPVRLVADPLQQVEPLGGARQDHRELLVGQPHLFQPLGQPADRDVGDAELGQHPRRRVDLWLAAVDDDQLRRVGELAGPAGRRGRCRGRLGAGLVGRGLVGWACR